MCSIIGFSDRGIAKDTFQTCFDRTKYRGPDMTRVIETGAGLMGFHRLAIMGLHEEGMQPFELNGNYCVCNGEIYGFRPIKDALARKYTFTSESDCEILLPLYEEYGLDMFRLLDAEFAMILYDARRGSFVAARDPIGIRPLYYGYSKRGKILFASEPANLVGLTDEILPFPPGYYYADGAFVCYRDITEVIKLHVPTRSNEFLKTGIK